MKQQADSENYIMKTVIICTLHHVLFIGTIK